MPGGRTARSSCPSELRGRNEAVEQSKVILSVAVVSQLHNHPSPTLMAFCTQSPNPRGLLVRRPPAWALGGLSTHAPGRFPVITGSTCLSAHQNSGMSARATPASPTLKAEHARPPSAPQALCPQGLQQSRERA